MAGATSASLPVADSNPWAARRGLTLGLLMIITLVAFEALAVATIMPLARDDLGGIRLYGWAFSAFLLTSLIGIAWAGEESDRSGPARPFLVGLALFGIGLVVSGVAPSMAVLVLGRALQGLGAGVMPTVIYVCIGRAYDESARPRLMALAATAWVVPGLIGPGAAAFVGDQLSWRLVFVGLLPLLAFAAWLTLPAFIALGAPAERSNAPRKTGQAIALAAGTALVLGGLTAPEWYFGVPLVAAGLPITITFASRLLPRGALRAARGLPSAVSGHSLLNLAFFGADAFVPFALITVLDQPAWIVGVGLTLATVTWTAGTWTLERLGTRIDRRYTMVAGLILVALQAVVMAIVLIPGVPVGIAVVSWSIGALGMGLAYPSFSLTVLSLAEEGKEGAATSAMKLGESLGNSIGAGFSGAIIAIGATLGSERGGAATAFLFTGAIALLAITIAIRTCPAAESPA